MHPILKREINFGATKQYERMKRFQRELALTDHIAFRRGKLSFKGWFIRRTSIAAILGTNRQLEDRDLQADIEQKRVDIMMGLDVAWLSSKRIVDRLIVVSADSDLIPAMKFARREGVQVVLVSLGHQIKAELREHSDEFREVTYPPPP